MLVERKHINKRAKAKCANLVLLCLLYSDDVSLDQVKRRTKIEFRSS